MRHAGAAPGCTSPAASSASAIIRVAATAMTGVYFDADLLPHAHRQRLHLRPGKEYREHDLVERGDEGKDRRHRRCRAGSAAASPCGTRARAARQAPRRPAAAVGSSACSETRMFMHDIRKRQHGVGDGQAGERADQPGTRAPAHRAPTASTIAGTTAGPITRPVASAPQPTGQPREAERRRRADQNDEQHRQHGQHQAGRQRVAARTGRRRRCPTSAATRPPAAGADRNAR